MVRSFVLFHVIIVLCVEGVKRSSEYHRRVDFEVLELAMTWKIAPLHSVAHAQTEWPYAGPRRKFTNVSWFWKRKPKLSKESKRDPKHDFLAGNRAG